jgi:ribonuclease-3
MSGSSNSSAETLETLQTRIGYEFRDQDLLRRSLRHASMGGASNERLEFLGDRVLGLVVAERLFASYPGTAEGGLAVRLNALVRRESCAKAAEAAKLGPHIAMANSEVRSKGRAKTAILANACEALIAAIYLDGGLQAARDFINRYWETMFAELAPDLRDAKTVLQEWSQSGALKKKVQPEYQLMDRAGPDHAPAFTVEVSVPGHEPAQGTGLSKREAEQDAARNLLNRLGIWSE